MDFLRFPVEVRLKVYLALLCRPEGIRLKFHVERHTRKEGEGEGTDSMDGSESDEEEIGDDGKDLEEREVDVERISYYKATVVTPVPLDILYTNRKIAAEASEVLYGYNRITFDDPIDVVFKFLRYLPSKTRLRIRELGFERQTTFDGQAGCIYDWKRLCSYTGRHMNVRSVTVHVPSDINHSVDESKPIGQSPGFVRFWWAPLTWLVGLLVRAKIQRLRLGYSATYLPREGKQDKREIGSNDHDPDDVVNQEEEFTAVENLRYPQADDEVDREQREYHELRHRYSSDSHEWHAAFDALHKHHMRKRQRHHFLVSREDDTPGDIGTVLVLTQPATCEMQWADSYE